MVKRIPLSLREKALLLALSLAVLATMGVNWAYGYRIDSDYGRWVYEVHLFSQGKIPYKDIPWQYPPAALYLYGFASRAFSFDLNTIRVVSAILYMGIACGVFILIRRSVPRRVQMSALFAAFGMMSFFSSTGSAPLSSGMYTPSQVVGGLAFLYALALLYTSQGNARTRSGILTGVACGIAVLSKQDFWVPVLVCLIGGFVHLDGPEGENRRRFGITSVAAFAATTATGIVAVGFHAGFANLRMAFGGSGSPEYLAEMLPSWGRLLTQLLALTAFATMTLLVWRFYHDASPRWTRWLALSLSAFVVGAGIYSVSLYHIGWEVARTQISDLWSSPMDILRIADNHLSSKSEYHRFFRRLAEADPSAFTVAKLTAFFLAFRVLNIGLPMVALAVPAAVLWKNRRLCKTESVYRWLLFLTALCIAVRSRRGFARYDWFFVYTDIPMLITLFQAMSANSTKAESVSNGALWICAFVFLAAYAFVGLTPALRAQTIATPAGSLRVEPDTARNIALIREKLGEIDSSGKRPVFPILYQSLCYFLDRPNPSNLTQGFGLTMNNRDDLARNILAAKPIVVVIPYQFVGSASRPLSFAWTHWEPETRMYYDDPKWRLYRSLLDAYRPLSLPGADWMIYLPRDEYPTDDGVAR